MSRTGLRKAGLVLAGVVMGLLGLSIGLWFYLQAARVDEVRSAIGERLQIARDAIEDVEVIEETEIRVSLRDVTLFDEAGGTILSAPRVALTLDTTTLEGDGAIEFSNVDVDEPYARLVQSPAGDWNFAQAMGMTAAGEPVESESGRPILLRDISLSNGRMILAIPAEDDSQEQDEVEFALNLPREVVGGVPYQVYEVSDVDARLPLVRLDDELGWRVQVASLSGAVAEPDLRIDQLELVAEQSGADGVEFDLAALRFGDSAVSGGGLIRFAEDGPVYDLSLDVEELRFADLQPILPTLPTDGTARLALDLETISPGRVALTVSGADLNLRDSRVLGAISLALGGEAPLALLDADLELAPLHLSILADLGLVESLPFLGDVTGFVSTENAPDGFAAVDLTASLVPADEPGTAPSIIFASGDIAVGDAAQEIRLDGLTVSAQPLYLASLAALAPEQADQLRGEIRGSVTLGGTMNDVRLADGDLSYTAGDAPTSRLLGLNGQISLQPELRYDVSATADPLALATLTELFPALPFRSATLSGPIEVAGDAASLALSADLTGPAGGFQVGGSVAFSAPLRFDLDGSLRAFSAGMVLRPDVPVEGPLTGTFDVQGTTEQFTFDVDLAQVDGRFTLAGTVGLSTDPPTFIVAGDVVDFRLGALLGAPELFADPLTGALAVEGGGAEPYVFDVDLTGETGGLDLAGFYSAGAVPSYEVRGTVDGLDLSRLPMAVDLPPSALTGSLDIQGTGIEPETIEGMFAFDFTESMISGMPLSTALGRIEIQAGMMQIDTLHVQLEETELHAAGSWGLTAPASEPLRYTFDSPDLTVVSRILAGSDLVPPQIGGSLHAEGQVGGSFEYPEITTNATGSDLRYDDWTMEGLTATASAVRDPATGWAGRLSLVSDNLVLPQIETFENIRLEASGDESAVAVGLFARRDAESDIALSGLLELEGLFPQGVGLETMQLRIDGVGWTLLNPARVHYTNAQGLTVENLTLERTGEEEGLIAADGRIPSQGPVDFTLQVTNFDLADLQRISAAAPMLEGRVDFDAQFGGSTADPQLSIEAEVEQLGYEGVSAERIVVDGVYSDQRFTGGSEAFSEEQRLFQADLSVPMNLQLDRMIPAFELLRTAPLSMSFSADSLPLHLVTAAVPGLQDGAGVARAQIEIGGTIDVPALDGWARIDDGAITAEATGTRYTGISADLDLSGNQVTVGSLSVRSGGTAVATGSIAFPPGSPPRLNLTATLNDFLAMDDPEVATVTASGRLMVTGELTRPVLTGDVQLSQSTFQVPELGADQPGLELGYLDVAQLAPLPEEGATFVPPVLGDLQVDGVEVELAESVWLESPELRIQITGDVVLYRTGAELRVFGSLQAVRGTYALEISGITREFDVMIGRVQFFGTGDLNPSIDVQAGYRVRSSTIGAGGDLTILVQLTGTLLAPRLQLSADAPVPISEADLISYLLFGQPSFELGGVTRGFAEQLIVQEVVGGLIASELERPIMRAGLCDWVRVRPGATASFRSLVELSALEGAVIECGWELAPDFFLTGQTGIGGLFGGSLSDWRLGVEWQIDNQWMWEASYGSILRNPAFEFLDTDLQTQFSTELRRQWEYGRPRQDTEIDITPDEDPLPGAAGPPLPR